MPSAGSEGGGPRVPTLAPPATPPPTPAGSRPGVVSWFFVYCAAMSVLYLAVSAAGAAIVFFRQSIGELDPDVGSGFWLAYGVMFLVLGGGLLVLFAVAPFLPRRPWVWVYDIVLICLGMTSACCLPASVPLLIFWIKPGAKAWFGR